MAVADQLFEIEYHPFKASVQQQPVPDCPPMSYHDAVCDPVSLPGLELHSMPFYQRRGYVSERAPTPDLNEMRYKDPEGMFDMYNELKIDTEFGSYVDELAKGL